MVAQTIGRVAWSLTAGLIDELNLPRGFRFGVQDALMRVNLLPCDRFDALGWKSLRF
jgi:hypothetical protein